MRVGCYAGAQACAVGVMSLPAIGAMVVRLSSMTDNAQELMRRPVQVAALAIHQTV